MTDLVNISAEDALIVAVMGYAVVFLGLILLMAVVMACGRIMSRSAAEPHAEQSPVPAEKPAAPAPGPGSAGVLKLYDTPPRDAAMVMAIVADHLGKPLNELRFVSIRAAESDEK